MKLENIKCNFCGGDKVEKIRISKDFIFNPQEEFHVVKCQNCGLAYVSPRPTFGDIGRFYPQAEYYKETRKEDLEKEISQNFSEMFEKLRELKPKAGRILDVGCGRGDFLHLWKEIGWDVSGVEMGENAVKYAKKIWGIDIVEGDAGNLNKPNFPKNSFDLITFSGVIEHLYDPVKTLKYARELLKDDGILMMLVPNIDSASSQLFGPYWYHLDVPRHLYHYNFKTARKLLEKTGFKPIYESNYAGAHAKASLTDSLKVYRLSKKGREQRKLDRKESLEAPNRKSALVKIFNFLGLVWNRFWAIFKKGDMIILYAKKA